MDGIPQAEITSAYLAGFGISDLAIRSCWQQRTGTAEIPLCGAKEGTGATEGAGEEGRTAGQTSS